MNKHNAKMDPDVISKLKSERILITGASGMLGRQLVFELVRVGIQPLCLVRESSEISYLRSLDLEIRFADLRDSEALLTACEGVTLVIHTAALVNFRGDRLTMFTGINSFGALSCYRASRAAGVKRFVHISSVAGIGAAYRMERETASEPLTESSKFNLSHLRIPYILSKHSAEELLAAESCLDSDKAAPELVTLNPSIIVAPSRHSSDRDRIDRFLGRAFIPTVPTRLNLVDIRDITPAIINSLAGEHAGKRYLLTGANLSLEEILDCFQELTGKAPRRVQIPRPLLNVAAKYLSARHHRKSSSKLRLYPDLLKMLDYDWVYDSSLARAELGFVSRPVRETLDDLYNGTFHGTFMDSG